MAAITAGAPKIAVTVLILSSVGANAVRDIKSHSIQNTLPPKKHDGMRTTGFDVLSAVLTMCGTAMPTNEIGPANAVTHADSSPERSISAARSGLILTPKFCA